MIESILSSSTNAEFTVLNTLAVLGASLGLGLIISLVYMHTHKREGYSASFTGTLVMMPAIVAAIIFLVGNNVARAFSLAGAFSLIRFRSAAGEPRDIAFLLYSVGVGLACGIGYLGYAAIFTAVMCLAMLAMYYLKFANPRPGAMVLKVTVPEDLNYHGLFDDLLDKYTRAWSLRRVKTSGFGTMFEVQYNVSMDGMKDNKEFLDQLRTRNGNLSISLTMKEFEDRIY
ncbi:MAG: DUF4956 domain-containing protein [Firmicutes bacterium]|nr:DUF4956 domain-containing protein [Bacillota bacterium]